MSAVCKKRLCLQDVLNQGIMASGQVPAFVKSLLGALLNLFV